MTVKRARVGQTNAASFTPQNPGDEIFAVDLQHLATNDGKSTLGGYTGGDISETIAGANQLSIDVIDPGLELLRAGKWDGVYDLVMDGVPFRLTQVSLAGVDQVTLLFEHRIIAKLRQHQGYLKVARDTMTRAQFIFMLVNEIKDEEILYVSPEIALKQPVAEAKVGRTAPVPGKAPGFAPGVQLRVKGTIATAAQLGQADLLLAECVKLGASGKVMQAIICAGIQETVLGADPSTFKLSPDGFGTSGVLQIGTGRGAHPIAGTPIDPHDTTTQAHFFLIGGNGMENGGALAYSRKNPAASPGEIARKVENPLSSTTPYAQWQPEAKLIVEAYTNSPIQYAGGPPDIAQTAGEFYRGTPNQLEDSWTCALRLANEVQWRAFVAGRHSFYYVQDLDLMVQRPRYQINRDSPGVVNLTFDVETGKRMVLIRGVRVAKPSTAVLTVRIDRWDAPPGTVVLIDDYGPANGRWLVSDIRRPLFDANATVTLHAPQSQLPEPVAATTPGGFVVSGAGISPGPVRSVYGISATGTSTKGIPPGSAADRIILKAAEIIAHNYPYVYGGGHAGPIGQPGRIPGSALGFDCSSFVSACLNAAGLLDTVLTSGGLRSWGQPGKGRFVTVWTNNEHCWMEFALPGKPQRYVGTTRSQANGGPGNEPWRGDPYTSTFQARHDTGM